MLPTSVHTYYTNIRLSQKARERENEGVFWKEGDKAAMRACIAIELKRKFFLQAPIILYNFITTSLNSKDEDNVLLFTLDLFPCKNTLQDVSGIELPHCPVKCYYYS